MAWQILSLSVLNQSKFKKYFVAFMIVPLSMITFSYLGRWLYELAAFTNVEPDSNLTQVKVMDAALKSRSAGYRLSAKTSPEGREFTVFVTDRVHSEIAAIRPPLWKVDYEDQPFCLELPLEQGRWGAVRALVPAVWDSGVDAYRICEGIKSERTVSAP